jgi:hypothetical protein
MQGEATGGAMRAIFAAVEHTDLSVWMREDSYAYFIALIFHAFGMAFLVGGALVLCLRVLLAAPGDVAGAEGLRASTGRAIGWRGFNAVLWCGAAVAVVSGMLLLAAYPAKALTNPLFAVKLASLLIAAWLLRKPTRPRAAVSLVLWLAGVATGKLLLHTYTVLTVG